MPGSEAPPLAERVIAWQAVHGRHDLPWQGSRDPYRIWVSEIMLQQTQVTAVIPYYQRFIARFPDLAALACAPLDQVLALWSGLGYYARARHLHRAALMVVERLGGRFPDDSATLHTLPGIGRSTAAAIAAFASGERAAILDGNVKRVLARHYAIPGFPGAAPVEARLWQLAEALLPLTGVEAYTQGLMDLGATVCSRNRPRCKECPLAATCAAQLDNRVADFPEARPRRARPERHARFLLLRSGARCLFQRRPPAGIWGGLWSLPEQLPEWLGSPAATGRCFEILHGFTHFRLAMTIEEFDAVAAGDQHCTAMGFADDHGFCWATPQQARALGLPAPIRVLIDQLAERPQFSGPAVPAGTPGSAPGVPGDLQD